MAARGLTDAGAAPAENVCERWEHKPTCQCVFISPGVGLFHLNIHVLILHAKRQQRTKQKERPASRLHKWNEIKWDNISFRQRQTLVGVRAAQRQKVNSDGIETAARRPPEHKSYWFQVWEFTREVFHGRALVKKKKPTSELGSLLWSQYNKEICATLGPSTCIYLLGLIIWGVIPIHPSQIYHFFF